MNSTTYVNRFIYVREDEVSVLDNDTDTIDMRVEGCEIKSFAQRDRIGTVEITVPLEMTPFYFDLVHGDGVRELLRFNRWSFGRFIPNKIAATVFGRDYVLKQFDLLPGRCSTKQGDIHFEVTTPSIADMVMFYSDGPMKGYAGVNGLTTFGFGREGLFGLLLPLNYLLETIFYGQGYDFMKLRNLMEFAD